MDTLLTGALVVLRSVFHLAVLWLFITGRSGRLFFCILSLFLGIGTWLWPALRKVALGEWKAEVLVLPLLIALGWALIYRVLRPRLNNKNSQYIAITTWVAVCMMFIFSQPYAAVIMLTVVDASDLFDEMKVPQYATVPVLVLLFWTIRDTLIGKNIEISDVSGLALLTMIGALLLLQENGFIANNGSRCSASAGDFAGTSNSE